MGSTDNNNMAGEKRKRDTAAEAAFSRDLGGILLQQHGLEDIRTQIQALNALRLNILESQDLLDSAEGKRVLRVSRTMPWRYEKYRDQFAKIKEDIAKQPPIVQNVLKALIASAKLPPDHEVYVQAGKQIPDNDSKIKTEKEPENMQLSARPLKSRRPRWKPR